MDKNTIFFPFRQKKLIFLQRRIKMKEPTLLFPLYM